MLHSERDHGDCEKMSYSNMTLLYDALQLVGLWTPIVPNGGRTLLTYAPDSKSLIYQKNGVDSGETWRFRGLQFIKIYKNAEKQSHVA
jgi:hypothetical protein